MPWRDQLHRILDRTRGRAADQVARGREGTADVRRFLRETVAPALRRVADELARHGRTAEVDAEEDQVTIRVYLDDEEEFVYAVKARTFRRPTFAFPEMTFEDEEKDRYARAMVYTGQGAQDYGILGYDTDQVIANFMHEYDRHLRWQGPAKGGRGG